MPPPRSATEPPTGRSPFDPSRHFVAVLHDVAPVHRQALAAIVAALEARVGDRLLGAVVSCWHGQPLRPGSDFGRLVRDAFGEVVQHGYTHYQPARGPISILSGRSNELTGLTVAETRRRLGLGRDVLRNALGCTIDGFVPPAWRSGRATMAELTTLGFRYRAGFGSVRFAEAPAVPLVTWSWDWGVVPALGWAGEGFATATRRLRLDALPCVAIHPVDVERGYLPRIIRVVDRLRDQGRVPLTFGELAEPARTRGAS